MKQRFSHPFVAVSAILSLFIGFHAGGFQLAISSAAVAFGLDKTGMGILAAVQFVSMIAVPLLFGLLADRIGKKPVLLIGMLSAIVGCLLAGLSGALLPYAAGIFCVGAGAIICEGLSSAAISDLYPMESARFITLCQCFFSIGAITGPIVMQLLMDRGVHWKSLYVIFGVAFLLCLPLLLRLRIAKPDAAAAKSALGHPLRILRNPTFFLLFAAIILYVGLETGFSYFAKTLFELRLGAAHMGAYALSAFWAGTAVSRLILGTRSMSAVRAGTISFLASAILLALLALSPSVALSLALSAAAGFAYGPIWSGLVSLSASDFPESSASAIGLMSTGCGIGGVIYPIAMGAMADRMDIQIPFFLLAATAFAGFGLLVLYRRRKAAAERDAA